DSASETPPGFTSTVAVWAIVTPLIVASTVLDSVTVELSDPVATPLALVGPAGCVRVFPVPDAVSTTGTLGIGLLYWSRTVTVIVLVLLPLEAVIVPGVAVTVVCWALTGPGTVIAVKVSGDATPVACTSWMLSVGVMTVPSVQLVVAMPLAFVVE